MPFEIVRNDITNMQVDAIVASSNNHLLPGSGENGAGQWASSGFVASCLNEVCVEKVQ